MTVAHLTSLVEGAVIPFGGDRFTTVPADLAAAFRPGDRLHVVQDTGALLHVPAALSRAITRQVDAAAQAFAQLRAVEPAAVTAFYDLFADRLNDDMVWERISQANHDDVTRTKEHGRSTTRLHMTTRMRADMITGLRGWADQLRGQAASPAAEVVSQISHEGWSAQVVRAPLGVIGFVFEGRPNVFADAVGVLATGNTAVLRIGGDALRTAQAIDDHALRPALLAAGLPPGCVALVASREHAAGWALFSDSRLALAVVRGSGDAVTQLAGVARQNGIPVSAHGTGGAWLVADIDAEPSRVHGAVRNSLDRKVCNTLNVAVVVRDRAPDLLPVILRAADEAAIERGNSAARIHVVQGSERWLSRDDLERNIRVSRAAGPVHEPRATLLDLDQLGTEWEWEDTPELSVVVVDDLQHAADLFNAHSPQFVASLISSDSEAHDRFRTMVNAPFVGDGFTRWVDGQYTLLQPELGLSNWQNGRLLARGGVLTGADLTTRRIFAHHDSAEQRR